MSHRELFTTSAVTVAECIYMYPFSMTFRKHCGYTIHIRSRGSDEDKSYIEKTSFRSKHNTHTNSFFSISNTI